MSILKYVGGGAIAVVIIAVGGANRENNVETVVAHYGLNADQEAFTRRCMDSLSVYDQTFKQGAKKYAGCGCMANELGNLKTVSSSQDYEIRSDLWSAMTKAADTGDSITSDYFATIGSIAQRHSIDTMDAMSYSSEVGDALSTCGSVQLSSERRVISKASDCRSLTEEQKVDSRRVAEQHNLVFDEKCGRLSKKPQSRPTS